MSGMPSENGPAVFAPYPATLICTNLFGLSVLLICPDPVDVIRYVTVAGTVSDRDSLRSNDNCVAEVLVTTRLAPAAAPMVVRSMISPFLYLLVMGTPVTGEDRGVVIVR